MFSAFSKYLGRHTISVYAERCISERYGQFVSCQFCTHMIFFFTSLEYEILLILDLIFGLLHIYSYYLRFMVKWDRARGEQFHSQLLAYLSYQLIILAMAVLFIASTAPKISFTVIHN